MLHLRRPDFTDSMSGTRTSLAVVRLTGRHTDKHRSELWCTAPQKRLESANLPGWHIEGRGGGSLEAIVRWSKGKGRAEEGFEMGTVPHSLLDASGIPA